MAKTTPKFSGLKNICLVHISMDWQFGLSSAKLSWTVPLDAAEFTYVSVLTW